MFNLTITPDLLAYVLAGLVAILFDWFPGLAAWYDALSELKKRQVMAGLLVLILAATFGLGCAGILAGQTCDRAQVAQYMQIFLLMAGINQGAHLLFKPASRR